MRPATTLMCCVALAAVTWSGPGPASGAPGSPEPRGHETRAAMGKGATHDRSGDALGNGFDIRRLVVRNKRHTILVQVSMYRGRARAAYTAVDIDPAPWKKVTYAASVSMNRRGHPTGADLTKYRGGKFVGGVACRKFRAGYSFSNRKERFTFSYRIPYRCIQHAKKARFRTYTQNNSEYGYDRTKRITVRRG